MPKYINKQSRDRFNNKGFEHDDRKEHDVIRRVSFKNTKMSNRKFRSWKNFDDFMKDTDIEMITDSRGSKSDRLFLRSGRESMDKKQAETIDTNLFLSKSNPCRIKQRRCYFKINANNSKGDGRRANRRRTLPDNGVNWFKVEIYYGNRYGKDYLLKLLSNYIKPTPLLPMNYKVGRDGTSFVVDDRVTAEDLLNADKRITVTDGRKLSIRVRPYTPILEIDTKIIEMMKKVMSTRYSAYQKSLDLSKFHSDPILLAENMFCPLSRSNVMMNAIDIISDSIPDVTAIDMSYNKIQQLDIIKTVFDKLPHLKSLSLSHNRIRDIRQLDTLKGMNLEEVNLDGNPLCAKYQNHEEYVRAVRQRFPKVIKLDGLNLPPPILFDTGEDETKLPSSKPSFMCDPGNGMNISKMFLERYYQIYDSDDRTMLLEAYHDDAQFSYDCCSSMLDQSDTQLSSYLHNSRNLFRVSNVEKRVRLLKKGKLHIIEHLKTMSKTQHDPSSFVVDLVLFSPELIQLNVCGLFKERDKTNTTVKYFSRVFIIIPVGTGFCIINEQLTILPASTEQLRKIAKVKDAPPVAVSPVAGVSSSVCHPSAISPAQMDVTTKQAMVIRLSNHTGMNLMWSEKCLNETEWNYDQAVFSFSELQKTGAVPAEAFVK
ncbi:nuclear RNA export factor 1-like isoform X2 [Cimex lectularius]|uniref:Nuclear RNA export factor 1 n=1 Tax=Cimex lectularius TaxID=79782 RepID=A0A8I6RDC2_CIMLE|nr:nuclear RNA export factor 1-like isoform X2 [Cimex lectularius]